MAKVNGIGQSFYLWIENLSDGIFNYFDIHKVGILGTVSIHLLLAIVLLIVKMNFNPTPRVEEIDINFNNELLPITEEQKEQLDKEAYALEKLLHQGLEADAIKNVAVDAAVESNELNPTLQDDKGINASDLYREAGMVKQRLSENKDLYEKSQLAGLEEVPNTPIKNTAPKEEGKFKGPAVISYFLEGRKAMALPVPSYKCQYGGQVVVDIEVSPDGKVLSAKIDSKNSFNDECIDEAAIAAAFNSLFTESPNSPSKQKGSITYLFVPQ
ncbi:MAG: hypothetical protein EHM93_13965 [Bacteroidales bacterium]|nr:MAG: hypothetical protein EHM93_13965 [Bacteroidales bacterium]